MNEVYFKNFVKFNSLFLKMIMLAVTNSSAYTLDPICLFKSSIRTSIKLTASDIKNVL